MTATAAPAIAFGVEDAATIFDEIKPLIALHYEEIAHFKDIALDPAWEVYAKASELGKVRVFTARSEGKLVGYAVFFVNPHMHYRSSLQAVSDVIFLHPAYRGQGLRLIRYADKMLAAEGVQVVHQHLKAAHNWGPALERMGYELMDLIYTKRLDKE